MFQANMVEEARAALENITLAPSLVVAGIDLGTTYSGFFYAYRRDPGNIYGEYNWPGQVETIGRPYCKTSTTSLYQVSGSFIVVDLVKCSSAL